MSETNLMRLPIINPLPDTEVLIKLGETEFQHELQDGNQFYIITTDKGIVCVSTQEREEMILNEFIQIFGVDEMLKLRMRFIKVDDDPNNVSEYLEDIEPSSEKHEVMSNGSLVMSVKTSARVIRFPRTDKTFDMVKVSKNILNLEKKDG